MRDYGHVGIACATTIAAFVSLLQYVVGLKNADIGNFRVRFWAKYAALLGFPY